MTLPVPLTIRLKTLTRDIHITNEVDDLVFGSTSPGGFDTATLTLHRPLAFMPGEVTQFGRMYVYDARNGNTAWEGRLQDPGRSAGSDGEVYSLAAVGGQAHLSDDTRMLYYVDTDPTSWAKTDPGGTRAGQVDQNSDANASGDPSLVLRIPQGTGVDGAIPSRIVAAHKGISAAGQKLARIAFSWDTGLTSASLVLSLYAGTYGLGPADIPFSTTFNIAGGTVGRIVDPGVGSSSWTNGRNWPLLRFHYTGAAGAVSADSWWLEITDLVVRTMMYAADGTEITDYDSGTNLRYADNFVYADQVVADLLGRVLTATVDGATATIALTTHHIDHLSYPDGVTPAAVLEDMIALEQGFTYHLWESNPATGKFRFEWVPWPTTVRYEADVLDGFESPASGNSVFNRVATRYRNHGVTNVAFDTLSAPVLTAAGFDRTGWLDLGDEAASSANAHRAGQQFLSEHQVPVNAGRLTVMAPILDIQQGRMVQPWEIRPGNLIRAKGISPYPNSLNNAGRDGNTVFRIAATSYSAADAAATLDLDSYAPSVARTLASLQRKPVVRRR